MQGAAVAAVRRIGRVDILCSNAGIYPQARLDEMTEADWDGIFAINVKGMFFMVQAVLPGMRERRHGRIVLTSSVTGPVTGYPGWAHYGATKAAMLGFMRSAAIEVAAAGRHHQRGDARQRHDPGHGGHGSGLHRRPEPRRSR